MQENGPESMATAVMLVAWIGFTLSTATVGLRVWVRIGKLHQHLAVHDWLMVTAAVGSRNGLHRCCLKTDNHTGVQSYQLLTDYSRRTVRPWSSVDTATDPLSILKGSLTGPRLTGHADTLTAGQTLSMLRLVVNAETFTVLSPMFGRIAVSLLILSIIGSTQKVFRITLWVIIAIQILENAAIVIELYTQCKHHILIPLSLGNETDPRPSQSRWYSSRSIVGHQPCREELLHTEDVGDGLSLPLERYVVPAKRYSN